MTTLALDSRDVDAWIGLLTNKGWTHYYLPNREAPIAVASTFWHAGYVDVIQLFDRADAFAYRAPMERWAGPGLHEFSPAAVVWTYGGDPNWTIRMAITLPPPGDRQAPTTPEPPPPMCRVFPEMAAKVRGVVIRPNTPSGFSTTVEPPVPRNPVSR
ncbi:MAG: hypothetical protein ABIQ18_39675 [Umezawaea sp.]